MIIECPGCSKQYDLDKLGVKLPPEGRTVRCKNCDREWRAMPAAEEVQLLQSADELPVDESLGARQSAVAWENNPEAGEAAEAEPDGSADWESGGAQAEGESLETGRIEQGLTASGKEEEPAQERNTGKVSWLGSFLRKNSPKSSSKAEPALDGPQAQPLAETIPFPRPAPDPESPARALDDARAAVRGVFASLGEQRLNAGASIIQAPVTAGEDLRDQHSAMYEHSAPFSGGEEAIFRTAEQTQTHAPSWEEEEEGEAQAQAAHTLEQDGFAAGAWLNADDGAEARPREPGPQNWLKGWQPDLPPDRGGQDDLDVQLRNAMRAHFPPRAVPAHPTQADLDEEAGAEAVPGPVAEALTNFWQRPAIEPQAEEPPPRQLEESDAAETGESFDERLYREIEETQVHAKQPRLPARGGLALTAAWGLFLCVAGGLTAGLFAFRDIAADALPGLAPFYQALGMPVAVQPLVFDGAEYDWTLTDNKPVLHIKGSVYNRAQRSVSVPDFVITVKDDDPALDREFPASLPAEGDRLAPGQRTDFEVEVLSPGPSINAVELELRNVR